MKSTTLKYRVLAGLLVTALLAPSGVGHAADSQVLSAQGNRSNAFLDLKGVSVDQLQSIQKAMELGLLTGNPEGRFRPNDYLTRQELAALLTRALQLPVPTQKDALRDVQSDAWSMPYIAAVKAAGIMKGDAFGNFRPTDVMTREEMAVTLVRASQRALKAEATPERATDWQDISPWARASVQTALEDGMMSTDRNKYMPHDRVRRADVAKMMLSTFFPTEQTSVLQSIEGNQVRINGINYDVSEALRGIFQERNKKVLQGAKLKYRFSGRTLEAITDLQLYASGSPARNGEEEFKRNLMLNARGAVLEGHLSVFGDYVSISDLTVTGNLHIAKELQHDFLASKLTVRGKTRIDGGDKNTVVFQESSLQTVDVNKQDVRIVTDKGTTVQTMNINSNALINADNATVSQINIGNGAQKVSLQGSLPQVTITNAQPVSLSGNSNIGKLAVNGATELTLNGSGTVAQLQVNQADSTVIVGKDTKVTAVTVSNGASISAVKYMTPSESVSSSSPSAPQPNTPPRYEVPIVVSRLTVGDPAFTVDLSQHFKDSEQTVLKYSAVSQNKSVMDAKISGNMLTLTAVGRGSATIRLNANDMNGSSVNEVLVVTVNDPPKISTAPASMLLKLDKGDGVLNLDTIFKDEDGDVLTYQAESSEHSVATVRQSGNQLIVKAVGPGSATINLSASDGKGGQVSTSFNVTVVQTPSLSEIPPQIIQLGRGAVSLDLVPYMSGIVTSSPSITASSASMEVAVVTVSGNVLVLTPVKAGQAIINVTIEDQQGENATRDIQVTVNTIPNVSQPIKDQQLILGEPDFIQDLSNAFEDADHDILAYAVTSSDPSVAVVSEAGGQLTVHAMAAGKSTVTVKAYDSKNGEITTTFQVDVKKASVMQDIPDQVIQLGAAAKVLDLSQYVTNVGHPAISVTEMTYNEQIASLALDNLLLTMTPLRLGETTVTLSVDDVLGETTQVSFLLKVTAQPNQIPIILQQIAPSILTVGQDDKDLNLDMIFSDPDPEDSLTYEASSSASSVASVVLEGKSLKVHAVASGTTDILLKASDGRGGEVSATWHVTVNRAPVIGSMADQVLSLSDGDQALDLAPILSDPDPEDAQNLTISISAQPDPSIAKVSIHGKMLTLTPVGAGQTSVQLTISDGRGGTVTGGLTITVNSNDANHAPEVVATIYEQVLTPGVTNARTYDLDQLFSDPDGDPLTFKAVSASDAAASVSITGGLLTLTPGSGSASAKVTITAEDGQGGKVAYGFNVRTAQLVPNGQISIKTKQGVKDPVTYDLSLLFPGQTSFMVYKGTPDSTFVGPNPLTGKTLTFSDSEIGLYTWIIGNDGRAAVIQYSSSPQGAPQRFISEYLDGGDGRIAIELSYSGTSDLTEAMKGYTIEIQQYMKKTQKINVYSVPIREGYVDPFIFIGNIFYDAFDITNITYFNDELPLYNPTEYNVVAVVLKRNGQVVDVLGDPSSTAQFMPNGGTLVRKSGIYTGSAAFSLDGEWNVFPKGTYQYLGTHTK